MAIVLRTLTGELDWSFAHSSSVPYTWLHAVGHYKASRKIYMDKSKFFATDQDCGLVHFVAEALEETEVGNSLT